MQWLKQNTAVTIKAGPFISATDGVTYSTGQVPCATTDVRLSKNGGDFAAKASATTSVYDEFGYYDVTLSTGDVGTLGRLQMNVYATTSFLPVWHDFMVAPANVWDSLFGSTYLHVNALQLSTADSTSQILASITNDNTLIDGSAINALVGKIPSKAYLAGTTNADGDIDASEVVANFGGSVASVAGAVASVTAQVTLTTGTHDLIVDKTWNELLADHGTTATMGDAVNRIASMDTDLEVIKAKLPSKTYLTGSSNSDGDIDASQIVADFAGAVGSITAGTTLTTAAKDAVADAVWDELLSGHGTTGTMGDAANRISGMDTDLEVIKAKLPSKSYLTGTTNSDGDFDATQVIDNYPGSVASVTAAVTLTTGSQDLVAGKVWDQTLVTHTSAGSFGFGVASVQGNVTGSVGSVAGNVTGSVASVASAVTITTGSQDLVAGKVWDQTWVGHSSAGSFGLGVASVQGNVTGSVGSVAGNVTGSVGSVAGNVTGSVGSVAGNVTGSVASVVAGTTLSTGTLDRIADAVLDEQYESTESARDYLRVSRAVLYGISGGGGTATATFQDRANTKARITATVSTDGDRSVVTVDATT